MNFAPLLSMTVIQDRNVGAGVQFYAFEAAHP